MARSPKATRWIYLVILSLIWGSSFILIKKALVGLSPLQLGAIRILFSALFLFLIGFKSIKTITKTQWKWVAISGFLGTFFPSFLFAYAETEIDSSVTSILNSLVPINTIIFGLTIFNIPSTKRQFVGVVIGFVGSLLLIVSGATINPDQNYLYAGFILLATVMYALNVNIIKRHLQEMKPVAIAVGNFVFILIPALFILIFSGFFNMTTMQNPVVHESLLYVVILSIFGTAVAKILFNQLIQISSPVFASSVTYTMPLVAVAWGLMDGELFSVYQVLSALIILLGVFLANTKSSK